MRAAVFHQAGQPLSLETLPDPTPGPGEVILKVGRCGICGTDLHLTEGHAAAIPAGTVPGHEFSGEVVALGAGVDSLKLGDLVAAMPMIGCGQCAACRAGAPVWCERGVTQIGLGNAASGGYAEYARAQAAFCLKLPAGLSAQDGALVEPLAVAIHGVELAGVNPGDKVLVIGAGPIGLAAAFWARRVGALTVAVTAASNRREDLAMQMGATQFVQPSEKFVKTIAAEMGGLPDVVLECVGLPGLMDRAVRCVRPMGTVGVLGVCVVKDTITPIIAIQKEVRIVYSNCYVLEDYQRAVDALASGAAEPGMMVTDTVSLDGLPAAFEALRHRTSQCKVMIDPWR